MSTPDNSQIAVCATIASALDAVVEVVRVGGTWGVLPIHWPDAAGLAAASATARAYVLHSDASCPALAAALGSRPARTPLIVVGPDPMRRASPSLWLPGLPSAARFARLIADLLHGDPDPARRAPVWRRKTDMIIGDSPVIQEVVRSLDRLAALSTPVLITGESGVGKELVARALHYCGPRAASPFIAINCAAMPDALIEGELFGYQRGAFTGAVNAHAGAIESAHNGTLFLDELGEMPLGMQAKLLRVLETGEVQRLGGTAPRTINFRLVSATNRNLEQAVEDGRFREDLYYRVHVFPVHVPPLRDRREDIPRIVHHHLSLIGQREQRHALRVTPAALDKLIGYGWPGNVRELLNLLERAVLLAGSCEIDAEHVIVPDAAPAPRTHGGPLVPYREAKARFELEYYTQLIRTAGGNISRAAKLGQKTRKEIYDALKRCGLDARQFTAR